MIMNVLKCICIRCSKLRIDKELHKDLLHRKGEARWKEVLTLSSNIKRCGQECEDGCGAPQPDKFTREGIARIVAHYHEQKQQQPLEVEYVHRLFRRITDEDVDFMGLSRYWCRPDWMICTVMRIPPPQVRPSVVQDNNQRSEDDLTHKLFEIIKNDKTLQQKIENNSSKNVIDEMTNVVQYHVATLVDNDIPGVAPSAQRSGRPLKSIQQRLGGKEGRIRYNIQGKRVEFSARSVITPDPNISIAEIGVPLEIAMNLTSPERVTPYNLDRLYKLIQNGADNWPGAKTIVRKDGRMISLKHVNTSEIVLYEGDVVNRHLLDNDILLFNRQPTLHKMSMMGHRVKVLPYKTFRLNVLVTRPYNADFDGDEMNAHIPQSYESMVELEDIAAIPHHIITPRHAKPMIGVYQDTLVGSYRLTQSGVEFTRREFMNLMMWNKRFDGTMPAPRNAEKQRWTGQQVLGALLPPINIEMGNKSYDSEKPSTDTFVKIIQGDIQQGVVDGDIYMKPSKGIIHVTYNDHGPKDTVNLLDSLQNTVENFLVLDGFSVGISDLIADEETKKRIDAKIQERKKQVEQVILQVHLDLFDNNTGKTNQQEFEDQIFGILNQATSDAGSTGQESLSSENRLLAMVRSGSKGEPLNVAQMMACLGQTAIEGKRVPYGFTDRTLPHYKKYDDSAESRGFIESSFIRGLTPQQFFFHAMSGREGLIDTAVKTADTGYIQRQLIKSMEDLTVQHDGTVRDANNNIIQYHYGEDGVNPTKIETQSLSIGKLSEQEIRDQFGMANTDWSTILKDGIVRENESEMITEYVNELLFDQRMMVEGVFQKKSLDSGSVFAPVNLARWILNTKVRFGLRSNEKTDLTPSMVLNGIKRLIGRTHPYHKIWCALLRFHLAPHKLIIKERFTKDAFEVLMELIVVTHMKSWVQPGDQVGIVAAQSIGEPATQMTLNSVDWDTEIIISHQDQLQTPKIGEWIDSYIEKCQKDKSLCNKIQYLENNQIYVPLEDHDHWKAMSCDENGMIKWTKLEAITRHPVVNDDGSNTILKVTLESGREVKATKGKSFLTLRDNQILEVNGSELKVGDELPISNHLNLDAIGYTTELSLREILPATQYLYGSEVEKALSVLHNTSDRHWFKENQGKLFTVPYSRSDAFRDAFVNGHNSNTIRAGYIYNKHMKQNVSQIPEVIPLDTAFGFFCGAYLAEGMSNQTQVIIANNDKSYLQKISDLMTRWNIGTHIVSEKKTIEKTGITGTSTSIIIHSTIIAKIMTTMFGRVSYEKIVPNWALQGSDDFVKGLMDGYVSGDGTIDLKSGSVLATSVSQSLLQGIQFLLARYHIFSTMTSNLPDQGKFQSVSQNYTLRIPVRYARIFGKIFTLTLANKQERLDQFKDKEPVKHGWTTFNDVVMDKIKTIEEVIPMGEGWVYDITVAETRNFTSKNLIALKDTFHQAGVASKSAVTRGVPRLRELLKVTQNPKASSLTIYLKPEYRDNKDKAREVVQDLELTVLRNITDKVGIYWDEKDDSTVVEEDRELMQFYRLFEMEESEDDSWSKWVLRLELNREEMFNRNISIQEVVSVIKIQFNNEINVVYSDYNSDKLIMRIRLPDKEKKDRDTASQLDDFTNLKKFQNKLLNSIVIRGLPGIKAVTFRKDKQYVERIEGKYEQVEQYVLDTDGSNFIKVMNHPAVDGTKLYSTNVWDVYEVLGIEATRAVLFNEINGLFESVGVNYRHLCLLCDVMTRFGRLMSIDRYGINKNDIGTLAKASFEETEKILLKAALFGEVDPVTGVSANIMMGQPIRGGTSFSQILLDDQVLPKLLADIDVEKNKGVLENEEEGDLSRLSDEIQVSDPCSSAQFQMNMILPKAKPSLEESEIEVDII
jgi:DNA-directed RNA polymerase beta' subunit